MKNYFALILLIVLSAGNTFAANYSETRTSAPYHALVVEGEFEIVLVPSKSWELTLEDSRSRVMDVVTILRNDTLFISQMNAAKARKSKTSITVSVDELVSLHVKGKSVVSASGPVNTDILTVRAEDGAVVNLDVRALKVKSKAIGCSQITISGSADIAIRELGTCGMIDHIKLDAMEKYTYGKS